MRFCRLAAVAAALSLAPAVTAQAAPYPTEASFYQGVAGEWSGPGEIVAGKYKGTKFNCTFLGESGRAASGMSIAGTCRVGVFNQPMKAAITRSSRGYGGTFLDGEAGEGMNVVGGRYTPSKLVVDIKRKDLRGVMVARLQGEKTLNITISVRVEGRLVPVIGMTLDRKSGPDRIATGSIRK